MIFPSLFSNVDSGVVAQVSAIAVIIFSYVLNKAWKMVIFGALIILSIYGYRAHAIGAVPGACGTMCVNNRMYYGNPYGGMPVYPYGRLPYHTMYGPTPYYFQPHGPSPYQPYNCVACMMRYNQFQTSPMMMPPGGMPASYL